MKRIIAWELARWQDGLELIEQQALLLLMVTMLIHLRQGSTRIGCAERKAAVRFDLASRVLKGIEPAPGGLMLEPMHAVELIETLIDTKRLGAVIGGVEDFKPLIVSGDHIYLQKMLYLEDRFAEVLRKRLDAKRDDDETVAIERALSDVQKRPAVRDGQTLTLNDEQVSAVREAARHPMNIISGGPGTGKTTIFSRSFERCAGWVSIVKKSLWPHRLVRLPTVWVMRLGRLGNRSLMSPEDLDLVNLAEPQTLHGCSATLIARADSRTMKTTAWPSESSSSMKPR